MYQHSQFGSIFGVCRGRITEYDGFRGSITCVANDGRVEAATLQRDYVVPPLPPHLNLCVGLDVQYEHHVPYNGGAPYAYNIHVLTPLPWGPSCQGGGKAVAPSSQTGFPGPTVGGTGYGSWSRGATQQTVGASGDAKPPQQHLGNAPMSQNAVVGVNPPRPASSAHGQDLHKSKESAAGQRKHGSGPNTSACLHLKGHNTGVSSNGDGHHQQAALPPPPPLPPSQSVLPGAPGGHRFPGNGAHAAQDGRGRDGPHGWRPQGVPERAPQPPVPYMQLNMPFLDLAARQPLPAASSRRHEPRGQREEPRRERHHSRSDSLQRGDGTRHMDRQRTSSRSPGRGRPGTVAVDDVRRRAAAVAAAHVRHRRRSSVMADLLAFNGGAGATSPRPSAIRSSTVPGKDNKADKANGATSSAAAPGGGSGTQNAAQQALGAASTCGSRVKTPASSIVPDPVGTASAIPLPDSDSDIVDLISDSEDDSKDGSNTRASASQKDKPSRSAHVAGAAGARKAKKKGRSSGAASARRTAADIAAAELEKAMSRVALHDAPVPGAQTMRLFCGHCGKEQKWDVKGEHAKPLPDPSSSDGMKRTRDGGRILYEARTSTCDYCGNMVMRNPLSAVCIYCDSIMAGFRPSYWKCTNTNGKALRRAMTGTAATAPASGKTAAGRSGASKRASGTASESTAAQEQALEASQSSGGEAPSRGGAKSAKETVVEATSASPCEYSRTCEACVNHDLRYRGRPRCQCPRLHGAIAGQVTGNKAGNLGWVMVH